MNEKDERAMTTISGLLEHDRLKRRKVNASGFAYSDLCDSERPIDYPVLSNFTQIDRRGMHNIG
jgi:hypothetical protein